MATLGNQRMAKPRFGMVHLKEDFIGTFVTSNRWEICVRERHTPCCHQLDSFISHYLRKFLHRPRSSMLAQSIEQRLCCTTTAQNSNITQNSFNHIGPLSMIVRYTWLWIPFCQHTPKITCCNIKNYYYIILTTGSDPWWHVPRMLYVL